VSSTTRTTEKSVANLFHVPDFVRGRP